MLVLLLAACPSESPGKESSDPGDLAATAEKVGDCKSSAAKSAEPDSGYVAEFSMSAEVVGDDVVLHMVDVDANCCPSPGAAISTDGSTITVDFSDVTADTACDCNCVFDFDVTIADVPSGTWTLDVYDDGVSRGTLEVTVP
ncbi:MAG: hypothetical protein ACOZNI_21645 [Myxococcota bacterium]